LRANRDAAGFRPAQPEDGGHLRKLALEPGRAGGLCVAEPLDEQPVRQVRSLTVSFSRAGVRSCKVISARRLQSLTRDRKT
jgi:hypothetical protein